MIAPETIKAATAEFCAMTLFVFVGCGTAVSVQMRAWMVEEGISSGQAGDFLICIAIAFGFAIAVLAYCIAPLSGGHINPAVTLSFVIQRKMTWLEAGCYWLAQLLGAIFGAALLWGCSYNAEIPQPSFNLGSNFVQPWLPTGSAFLIEVMGTFLLVLTVMLTAVSSNAIAGVNAPVAIGWSVFLAHLVLIPFTGCGINPARSAGPHIVSAAAGVDIAVRGWWVFYTAPFVGSLFATMLGMHLGTKEVEGEPMLSTAKATAEEEFVDPKDTMEEEFVDPKDKVKGEVELTSMDA